MRKKVLGIDLGTGNSCMSIFENGQGKVIPNAEGELTTPSIVCFTKTGERLVGSSAKRQAITNPKNTIHSVKRFIGRKFDEVKDIAKLMSYDVVANTNGDAAVKVGDKLYSPPEISSMVLQKLKRDAEAYIGETITDAVITVPAYFNDSQRQATKDAGKIAGLNVLRIINEPTAAALAYGIDKKNKNQIIAVYDIGQGTSDCSILECGDGVFEVLSTNGDSLLGGKDFDEAVVKYLIDKFKKENGVDLSKDNQALQRLTEAAEKAKCELSTATSTDINVPFISMNQSGPLHLNESLTRSKLEQLIGEVFDKFIGPCETCIKDSGKSKSEINEVLMVGGSTRVPYVQEIAKRAFNVSEVNKGVNPDEAVALGAGIQGAVLAGDTSTGDVVLLDVTPLTLSIETMGSVATHMIEKNTTIPTKRTEVFTTAVDNQPAVDIRICQGERQKFADNKFLGTFKLDGILPAPKGMPQIEVTFDLDANGILTVTAKDKGTGKEQHITITSNNGLSDADIERMVKDAELHAEEDKKFKEQVELINKTDSLINAIEKQLESNKDKISSDLSNEIKSKIDQLKQLKDQKDYDQLKIKVSEFETLIQKIGEQIYSASNAQQSNNTTQTDKNDDGDVIDAEVVE